MINENTLRILNDNKIGADIDALESYVLDFKYARLLTNMKLYTEQYLLLSSILKELKFKSGALGDSNLPSIIPFDSTDKLFEKYNMLELDVAYGNKSNVINVLRNNVENTVDLIALTNVDGLNIKAVYCYGKLKSISLVSETAKYIDLTDLLSDKIPNNVSNLTKYSLVEVRGKLTIFNKYKKDSLNIPCSVARCVRTKSHLDKLSIVLNDIIIDYDELPYNNQWEKINFMRESGFSVPHHALLRNIYSDTIEQAFIEFDNYFDEVLENENVVYSFSGIIVRFNNILNNYTAGTSIIYNSRDCNPLSEYISTIKSFSTAYENNRIIQRLNIIDKNCNDKLIIKHIDLDDLYEIEKMSLSLGSKVKFKVINRKAVLIS